MKAVNQLKTFLRLLESYSGDEALHRFLPPFFRQNKQMGSTDRRIASRLIYNYFRLGKSIVKEVPKERLFCAEFLCNQNENSFLTHFKPEYARQAGLPLDEKLAIVQKDYPDFKLTEVFPFGDHLSDEIDKQQFFKSHFAQPDLFIRAWPGFENEIKIRLARLEIAFREEWEGCLALPNGTRLDALFTDKKPYEVQDRSSQLTGRFFKPGRWENWWDACAASGGKSLMLAAQQRELKLVVSDMRENILRNLDERFLAAGVRNYQKKVLDLTQPPAPYLHNYVFDGIILDVPCTGSGTWGRTPELISRFDPVQIGHYQRLQKTIVKNVLPYLKTGKPLIYITCSVFKEENEQLANYICTEGGFSVEHQELIPGYRHQADSMFVARLIKN